MARDQGYLGSVAIAANTVAELNSWSIQFDGGIQDVTSFSTDDGFTDRDYTLVTVSGDISGNADRSDDNGQNSLINMFCDGGTLAKVWLYLYVSGAYGYYGQAVVTPNRSATPSDFQKFSASFQSAGKWYKKLS
jgi:hypothetical protein